MWKFMILWWQLLPLSTSASSSSSPLNVTLLHINDHHSHMDEITLDLGLDVIPEGLRIDATSISHGLRMFHGGAARIVSLIKERRYKAISAGREVLTLYGGDATTGTIYYTLYGPTLDASFINAAEFDVITLGNHEFDSGDTNTANFIQMLDIPMTCYNLLPGPTSPLQKLHSDGNIIPYFIKETANGDRIGVCGITDKVSIEYSSSPDPGTTIIDAVDATRNCVNDLKVLGINKIIVLSHVGYITDTKKLAFIDGVDVIVGAHSHSLLGNESLFSAYGMHTIGPYATMVNGVCIVTAWEYNKLLGELYVDFDADGNVLSCHGSPVIPFNPDKYLVLCDGADGVADAGMNQTLFLDKADAAMMTFSLESSGLFVSVAEDDKMLQVLKPFHDDVEVVMTAPIAIASENICHSRLGLPDELCCDRPEQNRVRGGVCLLVAQAMMNVEPNVDVALMNAGGCREDIKAGVFTLGDAYNVLPFDNVVVLFHLSGNEIKQTLEDAVSFIDQSGSGSYPMGAGLRWDLNLQQRAGNRISNLQVNPRLAYGSSWRPIDPKEMLTLAVSNYLANGKNGYFSLGGIKNSTDKFENTFVDQIQTFISFVRQQKILADPPLSEYSTQLLIDEDGRVTSIRDLLQEQQEKVLLIDSPLSSPSPTHAPSRVVIIMAMLSVTGYCLARLRTRFRRSPCGIALARGYEPILP